MVCSLGVRHSTWVLEPRAPWDVGGNEQLGQKRGALLTRDYSIGAVLQDRQAKGGQSTQSCHWRARGSSPREAQLTRCSGGGRGAPDGISYTTNRSCEKRDRSLRGWSPSPIPPWQPRSAQRQ